MAIDKFIKKGSHMQEVFKGAVVAFVLKLLSAGLAFWFNVLLARTLGAEGTGIYIMAFMVLMFFSILGRLGLDNVLLRFIASYAADGAFGKVQSVYTKGITLAILALLLSTALMYAASSFIARDILGQPGIEIYLEVMALAVTPFGLFMLHAESLKGLKNILASQVIQGIALPLVAIIILLFGVGFFGEFIGVAAFVIGSVVTLFLGYLLWIHDMSKVEIKPDQSVGFHVMLKASVPLCIVSVVTFFNDFVGAFMLGIYSSDADVGIFSAALRTAMLISFVLIAVNSIVAPKFSALYAQNDILNLSKVARQSSVLMATFSLPILLFYLFLPTWVMSFFGEDFQLGAVPLMVLAIGQFVNVCTGSVGYLLIMTGNEKVLRNNLVFTLFVSIILNYILIHQYGLLGAAVATSLSVVIKSIISVFLVKQKLGFWSVGFSNEVKVS